MSGSINLTWSWSRNPLPVGETTQVSYLLIEAQPNSPPSSPVPLNFCLVLDHSGSMQGAKLTNLKAATKNVLESFTPQDIVSVVIFDDTVQVILPATPVTDKAALLAQIDQIQELGGTAISLGLQAGQAEVRKNLGPERISHLLLLTDGQTWGDEDLCRQLAQSLGQEGVRITALGLGDEWNEKLLDDLAEMSGGVSDYIATPAKISSFFQRTVQDVQGVAAQDARLLIRLVRDINPRAVYRTNPVISQMEFQPNEDQAVAVKIGDLAYGRGGSALLDLTLPGRITPGTFRMAQVELHFVPVGTQTPQVCKQDVLLGFTQDATATGYNPAVMNLVERVTAVKLQTRALADAAAGNISGATQKLRAAATRLLDLGETELAQKTQQQAEQLEGGATIAAETQKELRYTTRRLTHKLEED